MKCDNTYVWQTYINPENMSLFRCMGCGHEIVLYFPIPYVSLEEIYERGEIMQEGDKFLTGSLSLGVLGEHKILVFKNQKKQNEKSPDFTIMREDLKRDKLVSCGALWEQKKKAPENDKGIM